MAMVCVTATPANVNVLRASGEMNVSVSSNEFNGVRMSQVNTPLFVFEIDFFHFLLW